MKTEIIKVGGDARKPVTGPLHWRKSKAGRMTVTPDGQPVLGRFARAAKKTREAPWKEAAINSANRIEGHTRRGVMRGVLKAASHPIATTGTAAALMATSAFRGDAKYAARIKARTGKEATEQQMTFRRRLNTGASAAIGWYGGTILGAAKALPTRNKALIMKAAYKAGGVGAVVLGSAAYLGHKLTQYQRQTGPRGGTYIVLGTGAKKYVK